MQIRDPRTFPRAVELSSMPGLQPISQDQKASPIRARRFIAPEPIDNRATSGRAAKTVVPTETRDSTGTRPQRVGGVLGRMLSKDEIDDATLAAANRWYRDYATGVLGGRDPAEFRNGTGMDAHDAQLSRIQAVSRCRAVRAAIGLCGERRLVLMLVDELDYEAMGQRLYPGRTGSERMAKAQAVLVLEQLTEHYHEWDRMIRKTPQIGVDPVYRDK